MARRKCWFITGLSEAGVSPIQAQEIFSKIGLTPNVSAALIKRFWHGLGIKEVDGFVPDHQQRRYMKQWDDWTRAWVLAHPEEFSTEQLNHLR